MKKKFYIIFFLLFSGLNVSFSQTIDWRFGFEYDEIEPGFWSITEDTHDSIMQRLGEVTQSQSAAGGINVNSIGGGWETMQQNENDSIHFSNTDQWVQRMQRNGFEIVWNLEPNARWASMNNSDCFHTNPPDQNECAPDSSHWQHWYNYVRAVAERYNGDGDSDMVGLIKPVRFYVMEQEVYFGGNGNGDAGEAQGNGYWEDNMHNLLRLHEVAYQAIHDADSTGNTKLIGSGALLFDLYGDFPDYPSVNGSTVQSRINGNNISSATYNMGWDSLQFLLTSLAADTPLIKCDYIGWHPHLNWKSTDQCLKLIKSLAPGKPIFIDDMWSNMLTTIFPHNGFTQFIGGDSLEGDFPTSTITNYVQLLNGLNNGDTAITNWYNAKGARDAVKCFTTAFGEGAERASFSLSNDFNPNNVLFYPFTYPFRYTGIMGNAPDGFPKKPVFYTMKMLVDKLHDFTSVTRVNVNSNPFTRVYKFNRQRGTSCFIAWSEANRHPANPAVPNGDVVTFQVISDTLLETNIITQPGITVPSSSAILSSGGTITLQLGFEPVIIEETDISTGLNQVETQNLNVDIFPDPATDFVTIRINDLKLKVDKIVVKNSLGQIVSTGEGNLFHHQQARLDVRDLNAGVYFIQLLVNGKNYSFRLVKQN